MRATTLAWSTAAALGAGLALGWVLRGALEGGSPDRVEASTQETSAVAPPRSDGPAALEAPATAAGAGERTPAAPTIERREAVHPSAPLYTLRGTVRDARGRPFAGADIIADSGEWTGREKSRAPRGQFVIEEVPAGTCRLHASAAGYTSHRITVLLTGPAGERAVELEVRPKRVLEVRVATPGGGDLETELDERGHHFARLRIVAHPSRDQEETLPVDGGDRWSAHPDGGSSTRIWVEEEGGFVVGLHWLQGRVTTRDVAPGQTRVDLLVSADEVLASLGRVTLRAISTETGAPVAVSVSLNSDSMGTSFGSGEEGTVDRAGLPPGAWKMILRAPGFARLERDFDLAAGQRLDLGDVALTPVPSIQGVVVDERGAPVPGAVAAFLDRRGDRDSLEARTKPDGSFELHGAQGEGAVCAWRQEKIGGRLDQVWGAAPVRGATVGLRLVLAPATEVLLSSEDRRSGHLFVSDRDGNPIRRRQFRRSLSLWLLPGDYVATRTYEDGSPGTRTDFTVGESWEEFRLR